MSAIIITLLVILNSFLLSSTANLSWLMQVSHQMIGINVVLKMDQAAKRQMAIFNYNPIDPSILEPVKHIPVKPKSLNLAATSTEPELNLAVASAILIDAQSGERLLEQHADKQHSIASITKLMSALVFVDHNPGWETKYTVRESDRRSGNKPNIYPGEVIGAKDLFYDALVASDNIAVIGLVNLTGLTEAQFVDQMNIRAVSMGLTQTVFTDPTGLSVGNVSTASEVARFARQAFLQPEIRQAVLTNRYELHVQPEATRLIANTDDLLDGDLGPIQIVGGKTGFIDKAGYCFVGNFIKDGQEVISVVLGADTRHTRFSETSKILNWHYKRLGKGTQSYE